LNRLLIVHFRSLPMYLSYAAPFWHQGDDSAREVLQLIAADHQRSVDRIGELIVDQNGTVEYGAFPLDFTAYHDLGFKFLFNKLVALQKRDIAVIEKCVEQLALAPMAKALAEECLGAAKGHQESLEELRRGVSGVAR